MAVAGIAVRCTGSCNKDELVANYTTVPRYATHLRKPDRRPPVKAPPGFAHVHGIPHRRVDEVVEPADLQRWELVSGCLIYPTKP